VSIALEMDATDTLQDATDEALVARLVESRDDRCVNELLSRHLGKMRGMIYGMVLNASDADDLAQESALRAFRSIDGFRGDAAFATWLYRIAVNTTLRFLERRARMPSTVLDESVQRTGRAEDVPEATARRHELERAIETGMAALSPTLRAAMAMVVMEGVPAAQAAEIEGCSVSTIYWRVHEGRKILKKHLADYFG